MKLLHLPRACSLMLEQRGSHLITNTMLTFVHTNVAGCLTRQNDEPQDKSSTQAMLSNNYCAQTCKFELLKSFLLHSHFLFAESPSSMQSVSQGQACLDKVTCCHTDIAFVDQTGYFTQSWYTDTGSTSPSTDTMMPTSGRVATRAPNVKSHT